MIVLLFKKLISENESSSLTCSLFNFDNICYGDIMLVVQVKRDVQYFSKVQYSTSSRVGAMPFYQLLSHTYLHSDL